MAYFQHIEDAARGDEYEGTSKYLPSGGLTIKILGGPSFAEPRSFESSAKTEEIYVLCTSQKLSAEIAVEFGATTCVEIKDFRELCNRVRLALPHFAILGASPVDYYDSAQPPNPRWALPDRIATSKLALPHLKIQEEYRFIFSMTDALNFQNVTLTVGHQAPAQPTHIGAEPFDLDIGSLADICALRSIPAPAISQFCATPMLE